MIKRISLAILPIYLALSVSAGAVVGRVSAQAESAEWEKFVWSEINLSISYPSDWVLSQENTRVSIRPADATSEDGLGAEFRAFLVTDADPEDLTGSTIALMREEQLTGSPIRPSTFEDRSARNVSFRHRQNAAEGTLQVIATDEGAVLALMYILPSDGKAEYSHKLQSILSSASFGESTPTQRTTQRSTPSRQSRTSEDQQLRALRSFLAPSSAKDTSSSNANLTGLYQWAGAGLTIPAPAFVVFESELEGELFWSTFQPLGNSLDHVFMVSGTCCLRGFDIYDAGLALANFGGPLSTSPTFTSIASSSAVYSEALRIDGGKRTVQRTVLMILDGNRLATLMISAEADIWADYVEEIDNWMYNIKRACTIQSNGSVNVRSGPGTSHPIAKTLSWGSTAIVVGQTDGDDGYTWWELSDGNWVREDVVTPPRGNCDLD